MQFNNLLSFLRRAPTWGIRWVNGHSPCTHFRVGWPPSISWCHSSIFSRGTPRFSRSRTQARLSLPPENRTMILSRRGQEDPGLLRLAKSRLRRLLACMGLRAQSHGECQAKSFVPMICVPQKPYSLRQGIKRPPPIGGGVCGLRTAERRRHRPPWERSSPRRRRARHPRQRCQPQGREPEQERQSHRRGHTSEQSPRCCEA